MNNNIIYEDDDIIVLNKPAHSIVNRSDTTKNERTVQDWAEERFGKKYKEESNQYKDSHIVYGDPQWLPELDFYKRGGIVHRLDKETSGILLIAKTPEAFVSLQKQFRERTVKKTYIALTHGKIIPTNGEINIPVGRLPWNRKRFGVLPGGKEQHKKIK